ncbi:MAG: hypothetical protein Q7T54_05010 [Candidatus Levybacteria bacterium]|nr:hypothetical protein [Candidatus Levybacteria bacterium]
MKGNDIRRYIKLCLITVLAFAYFACLVFISFDINKYIENRDAARITHGLVIKSEDEYFALPDTFAEIRSNLDVPKETIKQRLDSLNKLVKSDEKLVQDNEKMNESVFIGFFPLFKQRMLLGIDNFKMTRDQNLFELNYLEEYLKDNPNRNDLILLEGKVVDYRIKSAESLSKYDKAPTFSNGMSVILSNKNIVIVIVGTILFGLILIVVSVIQAIKNGKKVTLTLFWSTISVMTIFSTTFFLISLRRFIQ